MKRIDLFLSKRLVPVAETLGRNRCLLATRDGIMLAMPLVIVGSLLMIISTGFSIPRLKELISQAGLDTYLLKGSSGSFGLVGLMASFGITSSFAKKYGVDGTPAGIISLSCFMIVTPHIMGTSGVGVPTTFMAGHGLFVAIIMGLVNGYIYQWFINSGIKVKMPKGVPPSVSGSFSAILPGLLLVAVWLFVYGILDKLHLPNLHVITETALRAPLALFGDNLVGVAITVLFNSLFWFAGLHGGSIVNQMMVPIWFVNMNENVDALKVGEPLKHIFTAPFMDCFVYIGGCGATIGLIIVLLWCAKRKKSSRRARTLVPITLFPGLFNINEPVMFGIPVVLNILLLAPLVLAPLLNLLIAYTVMLNGLVPLTRAVSGWTTPPLINAYLVTGSINAVFLQLVLIVLDALLYLPFMRALERRFKLEEEASDAQETFGAKGTFDAQGTFGAKGTFDEQGE